MFIGHFGIGFGAKPLAPKASLGTLFLAAQFVDLLWPTLLLAGLETVEISPGATRVTPLDFTHYPISHSLLAVVGWSVLLAVVYKGVTGYSAGAWACGVAVFSHWVLDAVVHRPDLELYPGSALRVGLGLWRSLPATLVVEVSFFALGVFLYARSTRASDRAGSLGLWALVGLLLAVYLANLFGPPPPNVSAIAWVGQAQWLLVAWGYALDRHREPNREHLHHAGGARGGASR